MKSGTRALNILKSNCSATLDILHPMEIVYPATVNRSQWVTDTGEHSGSGNKYNGEIWAAPQGQHIHALCALNPAKHRLNPNRGEGETSKLTYVKPLYITLPLTWRMSVPFLVSWSKEMNQCTTATVVIDATTVYMSNVLQYCSTEIANHGRHVCSCTFS